MPWHLCYDRLIHVAGLGNLGTCMIWDLELKSNAGVSWLRVQAPSDTYNHLTAEVLA